MKSALTTQCNTQHCPQKPRPHTTVFASSTPHSVSCLCPQLAGFSLTCWPPGEQGSRGEEFPCVTPHPHPHPGPESRRTKGRVGLAVWELSIPTPSQHNSPGTKPLPPLLALSHKYSFLTALQKHTRGSTKELYFQSGRGLGPATHLGSSSAGRSHLQRGRDVCRQATDKHTEQGQRGPPESQPPRHPRGRCQIPCTQEGLEGLQHQTSQGGALSLPPRGDGKAQKMQRPGRKAPETAAQALAPADSPNSVTVYAQFPVLSCFSPWFSLIRITL